MYIRIKFFERKGNRENEKPFFFLEIAGIDGVKLMFVEICNHFYGAKFAEKIKVAFEKAEVERKEN
jgi:hypothetical protein